MNTNLFAICVTAITMTLTISLGNYYKEYEKNAAIHSIINIERGLRKPSVLEHL